MTQIYGFGIEMWAIYQLGISIYGGIIWFLSFFNDKAKKWTDGRRGLLDKIAREIDPETPSIWFHFASLGEFEQGRSVLEAVQTYRPQYAIVVTFYSPSGYEIRKETPLADHVFYLPLDTPSRAKTFIRLIKPTFALFTKYEYWPCYFRELASQRIPLYLISAIFRQNQVFFKWYGGFFRKTLRRVTHYFTQNEESITLLAELGITQVTLAGDTRFDRVVTLPQTQKHIPEVAAFADGHPVLVAGSTWPADEELLAQLHRAYPQWRIILAPHEIHEDHLCAIERLFPQAVRFSRLTSHISHLTSHVLLIDNIGMLSSLYAYGSLAYIGGGFGVGIHNTLEAATYGIPVIFGPNYRKFQEAHDLVEQGAGFVVRDIDSLLAIVEGLQNESTRMAAGATAARYVQQHAGATATIMGYLANK